MNVYDSLLKLYSEIEASVSPDLLKNVDNADSQAAEKIAKEHFLVSREEVGSGKREVSLHFQKKHVYDFLWGAVRKFFGFGRTPNYSFARNFKLIKEQFDALPASKITQPEKLEKLRLIVNALARHVEGENHQEISRIFAKKTAQLPPKGTPLPPPISSHPTAAVTKPAVKVPLNRSEAGFALALRGDEKGDREFLDYFLKKLREDKSAVWLSTKDKKVFVALGIDQKDPHVTAERIAQGIEGLLKKDKMPEEERDAILFSLGRVHYDEIVKEFDSRRAVSESSGYKMLRELATKNEGKKSASEKIACTFAPVRQFLDRLKRGEIPIKDEIAEVVTLLQEVNAAQSGLEVAHRNLTVLSNLPKGVGLPELPDRLTSVKANTINELIARFKEVNGSIAHIDSLKVMQKGYTELAKDLALLKNEVKALTEEPFYGVFLREILPFSGPLMDEIKNRSLLHDCYRELSGVDLVFQNEDDFSSWLQNEKALIQLYKTGIQALNDLKSELERDHPHLKDKMNTKREFLAAVVGGSWKTFSSLDADYNAFRLGLDADLKYAKEPLQARLTDKGYWKALGDLQEALGALTSLPKHNFDSYVNGLSKIATIMNDALKQYKTVRDKEQKANYTDQRKLYKEFQRVQGASRKELAELQKKLTVENNSARVEKLNDWIAAFTTIKESLVKPTSKQIRALEMSPLGRPPRLSHQAVDAKFEERQKALRSQIMESKKEGASTGKSAIQNMMERAQAQASEEDSGEWEE